MALVLGQVFDNLGQWQQRLRCQGRKDVLMNIVAPSGGRLSHPRGAWLRYFLEGPGRSKVSGKGTQIGKYLSLILNKDWDAGTSFPSFVTAERTGISHKVVEMTDTSCMKALC